MKKYIFIFLGIILCYGTGFATESLSKEQLKEELAVSKQDTSRLNILFQLINATNETPLEQISYIDQLLKDAEKQKNNFYKCQAYLYYMFQAYNKYDGEEVNKWMKLLEPLAYKGKFYDLLFRGKQCVIDMLLIQEQYELEEKEATAMLKEAVKLDNIIGEISAYHSLAYVYIRTYRPEKAFEVLEKAILLGPACSNQLLYCQVLRTMIMNCETRKDYSRWFKYLGKCDSLITELGKNYPLESFSGDRLLNNISYLSYYIKREKWEKAQQYVKLIDRDYTEEYEISYKYYYYLGKIDYYEAIKNWDKALQEIDVLAELLKPVFPVEYTVILTKKANLLNQANKYQQAIAIYKQAKLLKDSLSIRTINKQTAQLQNSYKTDLQILSNTQQQQRIQQLFLILAILLIVILIVFIIHANRIKRKLTKAEEEMREMVNETESANQTKERFLANISMTIRPLLEIIIQNSFVLASEEKINATEKEKLSNLVSTNSAQLMDLVNEILVLSRLEAKMMKFSTKKVELVQLIRMAIEITQQKEPGKIDVNIPEGYEITIDADENYLKQVIGSLCHKPLDTNKRICLTLEKTDEKKLKITFGNTALASSIPSQDIIIRNEINRMLIENFGGEYTRSSQANASCITLTFNI